MENAENPKNQLAEKLKEANNVLVTVSTNPTVDQLAAAIGLTLFLTKLKKHATTVFSGQIPSTIDFLKPEETIETNTDSLRDFIISLDKNKADKIRYKVEDTMVKIFITPYRTSIDEDDLVFSQGDFNVDVVVALGVQNRDDLDQVIMAHGRILHDAVVATVNLSESSDVGTLNWTNPQASSLCEMIVTLTDLLKTNLLDGQMATSLLTGIIAETERFRNEKTTSTTMTISAKLLAAGANQQLVSTRLQPPDENPPEEPPPEPPPEPSGQGGTNDLPKDAALDDDGSLRINHPRDTDEAPEADLPQSNSPTPPKPWTPYDTGEQRDDSVAKEPRPETADSPEKVHIDRGIRPISDANPLPEPTRQEKGIYDTPITTGQQTAASEPADTTGLVMQPPRFGGQLSATVNGTDENTNPLDIPSPPIPMLSRPPEPPGRPQAVKRQQGLPPEPYTVFDPEPVQPEEEVSLSSPPPPPPLVNLPKAAKPVELNLPPIPLPPPDQPESNLPTKKDESADKQKPTHYAQTSQSTGQPFVDMGDKTIGQIEESVVDKPAEGRGKKPAKPKKPAERKSESDDSAAEVMSDKTLDQIEEKVGKEHKRGGEPDEDYKQEAAKYVAKAMQRKTLNEIEESVDSPHTDQPAGKEKPKKPAPVEIPTLDYETHESEPEEKAPEVPPNRPVTENSNKQDSQKVNEFKVEDKAAAESPKQDEARGAVERAINTGGDGRTYLPPLQAISSFGTVTVDHKDSAEAGGPPPASAIPKHSGPSPNISIDPEDGTLVPLPPNPEVKVSEAGAESSMDGPPPVPPPMLPHLPVAAGNPRSRD